MKMVTREARVLLFSEVKAFRSSGFEAAVVTGGGRTAPHSSSGDVCSGGFPLLPSQPPPGGHGAPRVRPARREHARSAAYTVP